MRNPEMPDTVRDVLIVACGNIIGVAMVVEIQFLMPHDPLAATFIVIGAALMATAATRHFSRR